VAVIGCTGTPTAPTADPLSAVRTDPRFDAAFYASFATRTSQRRPSTTIYVSDTDNHKQPVPAETIASARDAAASLQSALGLPVDVRPLAGASPVDVWAGVTVYFTNATDTTVGGYAHPFITGAAWINYRVSTFDICGGLIKTVVRHELMHALGFSHTDDPTELMYPEARYCDILPSPREQFHARAALQMPVGSR